MQKPNMKCENGVAGTKVAADATRPEPATEEKDSVT
jgi:hypothetical protein